MKLRESIERYQPFDNEEEEIKKNILKYMDKYSDVLTRNNDKCHFTSSGIVLNKERTKVLMVFHNIYNSWIVPGGHADGDSDLLHVALKEVEEETGQKATVLDKNIFQLSISPIEGHMKRGKYVEPHYHLDVLYLLEPSTIKLNRLMLSNRNIFEKLSGRKIVINKNLLSSSDIQELEYEGKFKVFFAVPPLDERVDNSQILGDLLTRLGI